MNQTTQKIAIVHDHFLYSGGAERVLITLLKMYPESDVYLAFLGPKYLDMLRKLTKGNIFTSPFDHLPFARELADWFKPVLYFYWENLNLKSYDLVISSSHSFSSKAVKTEQETIHVSYIHTPPRFLYEEHSETRVIKKFPLKYLLAPLFLWMKKKDYLAAQRPDVLATISKTVQTRIKKYYHRESEIIYPPVDLPKKISTTARKRYFLCVSRLVKQKGIDLAIRACGLLHEKLIIVGVGREDGPLRALAGPTVEFKGFVEDNKMPKIYAGAKALIYCSRDEDFGLVPVEAMAYGIPVVAYASGGVLETVIDGKTGVLFHDYTVKSLLESVKKLEKLKFSPYFLRKHARFFSEKRFIKQFKNLVDTVQMSRVRL